MAEITSLKKYIEDNKVTQQTSSYVSFLEKRLKEISKAQKQGKNTKSLLDDVNTLFYIEKKRADECKLGFSYFKHVYDGSDLCMDFITEKYLNALLVNTKDNDLEDILHENFTSFDSFIKDIPNKYLIDLIGKKDIKFAKYISCDISRLASLSMELDRIKNNWDSYSEVNEPKIYRNMIKKLQTYFRDNINENNLYETETIIYLAIKNGIVDKLDKYYKLDDETVKELVPENIVSEKLNEKVVSISEARLIAGNEKVISDMDEIMKRELSKLGKVQKLK